MQRNKIKVRLSDLEVGEEADILEIDEVKLALQLQGMGCMLGEKIKVVAVAPFGDPLAFEVEGMNFSIRKEDAQKIVVQKITKK